jgi:hypothetical protein
MLTSCCSFVLTIWLICIWCAPNYGPSGPRTSMRARSAAKTLTGALPILTLLVLITIGGIYLGGFFSPVEAAGGRRGACHRSSAWCRARSTSRGLLARLCVDSGGDVGHGAS